MSLTKEAQILARSPLFQDVDPAQLKLLALMAESRTFHEGEAIMQQGDEGGAAFVLLEGEADVLVSLDDQETKVATLKKNEIVGEMSLLSGSPRTATVRAVDQVRALRIDRDTLQKLLQEFPEMSLELLKVLSLRLDRTNQELARARAGTGGT